jgi:nucleotide-binding universal stress UspA family protein
LRVLVGVDGSSESVLALQRAAMLLAGLGGSLRVVTAWSHPAVTGAGFAPPPIDLGDTAAEAQREALADAFGDAPPAGISTGVAYGSPAAVLVEESREADLLVVGSRGRGGFVGLLLGSVSRTCTEHAHCDVLIVRNR